MANERKVKLKCDIIGSGKVGLTLTEALAKKDFLGKVYVHSKKSFDLASEVIDEKYLVQDFKGLSDDADVTIIAVPESGLDDLILQLNEQNISANIFAHTGGINSRNILNDLRTEQTEIAAVHPYQTFYTNDIDVLKGIAWAVECEEKHKEIFEFLIENLDGKPIFLNAEQAKKKAMYHASAVTVSNYMTMLFEMGVQMCNELGLEPNAFIPGIAERTLQNNIKHLGTEEIPLTGPIARGDTNAIARHLEVMEDEKIRKAYKLLSLSAAELSYNAGLIDANVYDELKKILDEK